MGGEDAMTILFFCNLSTEKLGAFEHLIIETGRRLSADGDHLVVIFGAAPSGPVPEALKQAGIAWGHIKGWSGEAGIPNGWRCVRPALKAIREYKPDLVAVHFGNEFPVLVTSFLTRLLMRRAPFWVWHQRQQIVDPGFFRKRISRLRLLGLGVGHYVVSYDGGRNSLLARGIKSASITRIYNAVLDYKSQKDQGWLRRELNLPMDSVLAANVGWLVSRKRIDITIRAFAKVSQKLPSIILLVVGDGPERAALEACAVDLGVAERVRFLGARNDVRDILAECDCLVHSSIAETCTNVVNESMAAGIPAVIMNAGAAEEQIASGVSGFVVGPHDEQALAEKLEEVMRSKETRDQMGLVARRKWKELFNLDVTAAEHCDLYRQLLGRTRLPPSVPTKTLFFCNLIPLKTGAYEKLLESLGREFRKEGDELVLVFSGEPIVPVAESLRAAGIRWHILKEWADGPGVERAWGFVLPALRLLRLERPDVAVVHFGNELPALVTILLSRLMGMGKVKWVWQQHQQVRDPNCVTKFISRLRLHGFFTHHFVAVYEGGRESMRKRGIPLEKITVIYNSVTPYTTTRQKGWLRQELGIGPEDVILVTIGSLIPRKRIDFLLRACAQLTSHPSTLSPWHLLVIGEGPERQRLLELAGELGIVDRLHFLGMRNDVREILPECDIYLHASRAETCTYAVTEAMAAGIPAVMLDAGAAKEQIQNGVSGYVLEKEDSQAFAARVDELMSDVTKRTEMGRMAFSQWREKFTMAGTISAYRRLCRTLGGVS